MSTNKTHQNSNLYQVIVEVRKLFHSLAEASNAMNREAGITVSMRAVMEALYPDHAMAVPDIARKKNVTRQHIQQLVNELLARKLAYALVNPAHKRSALIRLSVEGIDQFKLIIDREKQLLAVVADQFDDNALLQSVATLQEMRALFDAAVHSSTSDSPE